ERPFVLFYNNSFMRYIISKARFICDLNDLIDTSSFKVLPFINVTIVLYFGSFFNASYRNMYSGMSQQQLICLMAWVGKAIISSFGFTGIGTFSLNPVLWITAFLLPS